MTTCYKCGMKKESRQIAAQFVRKSRTAVSAPICPRCGSNRQVWKNQLNGKMMCHRVGCYIVLHNDQVERLTLESKS